MSSRIGDYALVGDTHTGALVGKDGSIDWLCVPRFDSAAVFDALLGSIENGRWQLAPAGGIRRVDRQYRGDTLILETSFHTDDGVVRVIDCMPIRQTHVAVIRIVEGVSGRVPCQMNLRLGFDYGSIRPWVIERDDGLHAIAGPDSVRLAPHWELNAARRSGQRRRRGAGRLLRCGREASFMAVSSSARPSRSSP